MRLGQLAVISFKQLGSWLGPEWCPEARKLSVVLRLSGRLSVCPLGTNACLDRTAPPSRVGDPVRTPPLGVHDYGAIGSAGWSLG